MKIIRMVTSFILAGALILTTFGTHNVVAQNSRQETDLPTAFLTLFADQPDYMADMTIVVIKNAFTQRVARKADRTRWEFSLSQDEGSKQMNQANRDYKIIVITSPDQMWLGLDPQEKTYAELPDSFRPKAPDMRKVSEQMARAKNELKVIVEPVGTETLDGHRVEKIRMTPKGYKPGQGVFFYIAKDLKNLLVKMEVNDLYEDRPTPKGETMSMALSNISLDVPDDLFQVPAEYKKVDFDSFMSTAKQNAKR